MGAKGENTCGGQVGGFAAKIAQAGAGIAQSRPHAVAAAALAAAA
jgi:hypothetical protein